MQTKLLKNIFRMQLQMVTKTSNRDFYKALKLSEVVFTGILDRSNIKKQISIL